MDLDTLGHKSVFYEEDNDKKFLAFHTRFPDQGETFESRIHPFYMNDNDWPVALSLYRGKIGGKN